MQTSIYDTSPENFAFGGGSSDSVIHPAVAAALVVVIAVMLIAKRKTALTAMFLFLFLVPSGQVFYVAGVHLYCSRILVIVGGLRLLWARFSRSGDIFAGGFNAIDGVFLTWALYRAMAGILLFMQKGAVINQIGFLWDAVGMYFVLRLLIQDQEDIERLFQVFAVLAVAIGAEMVREHYTNQDLFGAILGGTRSTLEVRNGLIRAQGPFQHALIAGSFGAALFPAFVWLWKGHRGRILGLLGMVGSITIAFMARVSTPILALVAGIGLIFAWPIRGYLKYLRWGLVVALIGLNVVMKAPVWYLLARIDLVGGSTSYQRAQLIDLFFRHFGDWWLIGTNQNASWGWDMWDTANQYVNEGERGGLVVFVCFLVLIWLCFRRLYQARTAEGVDHKQQWFFWLLGCVLFTHCVAYFGVDYYDQSRVAWYATIAMIIAATAPVLQRVAGDEPASVVDSGEELTPAFSRPVRRVTGVATVERRRPLKAGPTFSRPTHSPKFGKT